MNKTLIESMQSATAAAQRVKSAEPTEYLLVTDKTSKILQSGTEYQELRNLATTIRSAGGEVTMFKSIKG